MKTTLFSLLGLALLIGIGCGKSTAVAPQSTKPISQETTEKPATVTVNKPVVEQAVSTFSLSVPFEAVDLKQGAKKSIVIGINRGENFAEEVAIEVADLPPGVTLESQNPVIKHGSKNVELTLLATPDAALGDFTAKIEGRTASSGADFSKELKITIAQK